MNSKINVVDKVDFTFIFIYSISFVVLLGITIAIIYFLFKYNKKRHPVPSNIKGNLFAEITWTVIPTIIVMAMFFVGWDSYVALRSAPKDSIEINVEGKMWSWKFIYPTGVTSNELYIPLGKPVKFNITSVDVIHSFYIPAYRIKVDAVPGMTNYAWIKPDKKGDFDILCAEYCGVRHAYMISKVHVIDEKEYTEFLAGNMKNETNMTLEELLKKHGCSDCHSLDGTVMVGPPLNDIAGQKRVVITDGKEREVVVDENYLKNAILYPEKDLLKGFENIMPSYKDQLPDNELNQLINLLLGKANISMEIGKNLIESEGCLSCHSTDGSVIAAPSFKNLYNSQKTVIKDNKEFTFTADDEYLFIAIKYPEREIVKGYDPIMPSYSNLNDEQVKSIIEYIKSLQ